MASRSPKRPLAPYALTSSKEEGVPPWPSLAWKEEWKRVTKTAWFPRPTVWETFCTMATALDTLRRQGNVSRSRTSSRKIKKRQAPSLTAQLLLKEWLDAQALPQTPRLDALASLFETHSRGVFEALLLPDIQERLLTWLTHLHARTKGLPAHSKFFTSFLRLLITQDITLRKIKGAYVLAPLFERLAQEWLPTSLPDASLSSLAHETPYPALIRLLAAQRPHLVTPLLLEGTHAFALRPEYRFKYGKQSAFFWNKEEIEGLTALLASPANPQGLALTDLLKRLPEHWRLERLRDLSCHRPLLKKAYPSVLHFYAALRQSPLTPALAARALAWCFSVKRKQKNLNTFALSVIDLALGYAVDLWRNTPVTLSPRLQRYIHANLQRIERFCKEREALDIDLVQEIRKRAHLCSACLLALQLEETLPYTLSSSRPRL